MTNEHIWEKWIKTCLPGIRRVHYLKSEAKGTALTPPIKAYSRTMHVVCKACNTGWMAQEVTAEASKILCPMLKGAQAYRLTPADQTCIATWAVLRSLATDLASEEQLVQDSERHRFFENHGEPPPGTGVWLGAFKVSAPFANLDYIHHAVLHSLSGPGTAQPEVNYLCTMIVGKLVVRVASFREVGRELEVRFLHDPATDRFLIPIWPNHFTVEWPGTETLTLPGFLSFRDTPPMAFRFDLLAPR